MEFELIKHVERKEAALMARFEFKKIEGQGGTS
jgi:hypothetical protein